jgi:phosphoribosyl-ATP pyrophosphohydrolase
MTKPGILEEIYGVIDDRFRNPKEGSYVTALLCSEKGIDRVLEKVGEEAVEFVIAVKNNLPERTIEEAADLQFHLLVALRAAGISLDDVMNELEKRDRKSVV